MKTAISRCKHENGHFPARKQAATCERLTCACRFVSRALPIPSRMTRSASPASCAASGDSRRRSMTGVGLPELITRSCPLEMASAKTWITEHSRNVGGKRSWRALRSVEGRKTMPLAMRDDVG